VSGRDAVERTNEKTKFVGGVATDLQNRVFAVNLLLLRAPSSVVEQDVRVVVEATHKVLDAFAKLERRESRRHRIAEVKNTIIRAKVAGELSHRHRVEVLRGLRR